MKKKKAQEIRKTLKRIKLSLRKILEFNIDGIIITNKKLKIIRANKRFLKVVQASNLAQVVGKNIIKFIPLNQISEFKIQISRAKLCSKIVFEMPIKTLTNFEIYSIITIIPLKTTKKQNILGYIFTIISNEEDRRVELIKGQLSKYQKFISEYSQKALVSYDEDSFLNELSFGLKSITNAALVALFYHKGSNYTYFIRCCTPNSIDDYKDIEFNASNCAEIFYPISTKEPYIASYIDNNDLCKFSILANRFTTKSLLSNCIWLNNHPTGVLVLYYTSPKEFSIFEIQFILSICTIISNLWLKKSIENELLASKKLLNTIIETIPESVLIVQDYKIIFSNLSAQKLLELHRIDNSDNILITNFIHPDYIVTFEENIQDATTDFPKIFELPIISSSARVIPVEMYLKKLLLDKKYVIFLYIRDLTSIKKSEFEKEKLYNQLFQAQKIEIIGRLAGGIAHDYNNMLGVILGHIEFLEELINEIPEAMESLREIKKAAESSANLTRQLLAFSRQQVAIPKETNVNDVIKKLEKLIKKLIGENVELVIKLDPLVPIIKIDPTQLEQIITNLCINAKDAINGKDNGRLEIITEPVKFVSDTIYGGSEIEAGEYVKISFIDNGIGMDEETLNNAFEPFYTTKDKEHGTGLGLATVLGIVKQNKGYITVTSQIRVGTKFEIFFPAVLPALKSEMNKNNEFSKTNIVSINLTNNGYLQNLDSDKSKVIKIMIVEDDENILHMVKKILEINGYKVYATQSPEHAINLIKMHEIKFDLVIVDIILPQINGIKLAEEIKKIDSNVKIALISGYPIEVIRKNYELDPTEEILQKPFTSSELINFIKKKFNNT